jgi:hypothetical protein
MDLTPRDGMKGVAVPKAGLPIARRPSRKLREAMMTAAAAVKDDLDRRAEIERRYAGWHAWVSSAGIKYATHTRGFGGQTLCAPTWEDLDAKLADSTMEQAS